jgi:hypothetical protein
MNFFEGSARVPLLLHAPGRWAPRAVAQPTSLLDVLPTLVELAGGSVAEIPTPLDGRSLLPLAEGNEAGARIVWASMSLRARLPRWSCCAAGLQIHPFGIRPAATVPSGERSAELTNRARTRPAQN